MSPDRRLLVFLEPMVRAFLPVVAADVLDLKHQSKESGLAASIVESNGPNDFSAWSSSLKTRTISICILVNNGCGQIVARWLSIKPAFSLILAGRRCRSDFACLLE